MSTQHNKENARRFFLAQDRQNGPLDSELVASDYRATIGSNPPMDMAGHSAFGVMFYQGFPDIYHTIDDVVGEGERVVVRFTLRGNHTGNFMGIPATSKSVEVGAMALLSFREGKIAELQAVFDQVGLMQQLGVIPG